MKIIQVHNYYQQAGGEDAVVAAERALLEEHGHRVVPFYKTNEALGSGLWALLKASVQTIWNHQTYREFRQLLRAEQPDVVHCHNTFPLISPSIYRACAKEGVPVVQTLHNYRLLCLNAFLFRQNSGVKCDDLSIKQEFVKPNTSTSGAVCELCVSKRFKWPGIKYGCYRESRAGSLVVALMLFVHKLLGTWSKKVSGYIALTEFQKQKMIEGGLPGQKIFVKPNFLQRSEVGSQKSENRGPMSEVESQKFDEDTLTANVRSLISGETPFALFVGRLSPEKGCDVLIRAWSLFEQKLTSDLPTSDNQKPQLLIVGDGPERESLEKMTSDLGLLTSVRFLGKQPKESVLSLMRYAQFLVFPSVWYETFGLTVLEAGLQRTASLVSSPSTTAGLIDDSMTGVLFDRGNASDLSEKLVWSFSHPDEIRQMGAQAKCDFDSKYSASANVRQLMAIYEKAMASR